MDQELVTVPDAESLATRAAAFVAGRARAAIADHGQFSFAVSGRTTPWAMFAQLAHRDLPWASVRIYQVDERVAPDGDPDRNLTHLRQSLGPLPAVVHPMPVTAPDWTVRPPPTRASYPAASTWSISGWAWTGTRPRWCPAIRSWRWPTG